MNKTVKLLFYCTVAKPNLYMPYEYEAFDYDEASRFYLSKQPLLECDVMLNGKIVAEAECELVEKNGLDSQNGLVFDGGYNKETCLTLQELANYVGDNYYYAIHLKNVKPFEIPKELSDYSLFEPNHCIYRDVKKAPQNMCRIVLEDCPFASPKEEYVIISIKPEWLCKILNGEKTIEVRTSILNALKELIENESKRLF